jgi:D-alanine-D-alanine ligase
MKKKVALVAGGDSGEYEVSISSAKAVKEQLVQSDYEVYLIVMQGTDWHYEDDDGFRTPVNRHDFSIRLHEEPITFDVVFILIHGAPGEDGRLQGYFDLLGIPYTGSDLFTSSLTFKKSFNKYVATAMALPMARWVFMNRQQLLPVEKILQKTGMPCFVKPNKGGSSVGITKVKTREDLIPAIDRAFQEDDEVLVEEAIEGIEINCGVFRMGGNITALPLTEIVPKNEFFDYEAKYLGASDEITPARISESLTQTCRDLSVELYDRFQCRGLVRFDYILKDDVFYFLEVNTIPGLSAASIVPQQIRAAGMKESDVYAGLIEEALQTR